MTFVIDGSKVRLPGRAMKSIWLNADFWLLNRADRDGEIAVM